MALFLFIVFLIVAIVGRVALQYKITGNHGLRPTGINSPTVAKISSLLFLISFVALGLVIVLSTVGTLETPSKNKGTYFGVFCSVVGIAVTVISQYQMGASWRIGVDESEQTALIVHGIYSYVRNPIYTGVLLFCAGLLIQIPSLYMLLILIFIYASVEIHVRGVEEPYLEKIHGVSFTDYCKRAGRYLPLPKKPKE